MNNLLYIFGGIVALVFSFALSAFSGTLSYSFYEGLDLAPGFGFFGPTVSALSVALGFLTTICAGQESLKKLAYGFLIATIVLFGSDIGTNIVIQLDKKAVLEEKTRNLETAIVAAKQRYDVAIVDLEEIAHHRKLLESDKREEIEAAQRILRSRAGYKMSIDGTWGNGTLAAVERYKPQLDEKEADAIKRRDANEALSAKSGNVSGTTFNEPMAWAIALLLPTLALLLSFGAGKLFAVKGSRDAKQLSEAVAMAKEAVDEERQELRDELAEVRLQRQARLERETLLAVS